MAISILFFVSIYPCTYETIHEYKILKLGSIASLSNWIVLRNPQGIVQLKKRRPKSFLLVFTDIDASLGYVLEGSPALTSLNAMEKALICKLSDNAYGI